MNARTTSLLIVLALALTACVAPVQAPQIKAPQTQTEQALPIQSEPAQNKLPAVTNPWAYPEPIENYQQRAKDAQAARLLAEQQALTDKLMTGLPMQIRDDIAIYAAIKVAEMETAPSVATTTSTGYPDILRSVMEGQTTTTPYVLPEQMTTNPKQPAVQELDDMLKPENRIPVSETSVAEKIAQFKLVAAGIPIEVQNEIIRHIEESAMPASTMPVRDQWYLEEQSAPSVMEPWYYFDNTEPAPAMEPYWENFFKNIEHGR